MFSESFKHNISELLKNKMLFEFNDLNTRKYATECIESLIDDYDRYVVVCDTDNNVDYSNELIIDVYDKYDNTMLHITLVRTNVTFSSIIQ